MQQCHSSGESGHNRAVDELWSCTRCGRSLDRIRQLTVVPGGGYICNECVERRKTRCHTCGERLKDREYIETYGGQRVCLTCMKAHCRSSQVEM